MSIESSATNPPTLPRRVLGRRLRELREGVGMSRANAARRCEMGAQTLWRLETGRNSETKKIIVNALCDVYEASTADRRELLWLVDESRKDGWWQSYADTMVPEVEMFIGLEQAASRSSTWQSTLIPGLLQTPGYRQAVWEIGKAQRQQIDLDRETALLGRRQERLNEPDRFTLRAIICESALRRRFCGSHVMAGQLDRLIELGDLPNLSVRVVPLAAPSHSGLINKDFVYLEFPEHPNPVLTETPVVYVEGFTGDLYLDKPIEISTYEAAWADIDRVALNERETRSLVAEVRREFEA
ncbi:helix-turn-helix transcriptional regulator [Nocardia rhamnosiphila]|uniref:helix-turn-helix domain-containing protein n=1 Tax=Nocardia rhamnosiphila TaxID=426716 RepID=UPI0033E84932